MAMAGVGMVMVSLTRRLSMTMSRVSPLLYSHQLSPVGSDSQLEKTETGKLEKRLEDEFQLFLFFCFFPPSVCSALILQGCKRIVKDSLAPAFTPLRLCSVSKQLDANV